MILDYIYFYFCFRSLNFIFFSVVVLVFFQFCFFKKSTSRKICSASGINSIHSWTFFDIQEQNSHHPECFMTSYRTTISLHILQSTANLCVMSILASTVFFYILYSLPLHFLQMLEIVQMCITYFKKYTRVLAFYMNDVCSSG